MADTKISALTAITTPLAGTEPLPIVQSSTTKKVTVAQLQAAPIAAQNANCLLYTDSNKSPATSTKLAYDGSVTVSFNGGATPPVFEFFTSTLSAEKARITNSTATSVGLKLSSDYFDIELAPGVLSSANVKFTASNLVQGTAAKGVNFTANTGAAGMTSQLLNWYEEGTWTPALTAGVGSLGSTGSATGKYTRVGSAVTLYFTITITNNGTSSGYLRLTGMPFNLVGNNLSFGFGAETGVSSKALTMYQNSATEMIVLFADGTYPGATNAIIAGVIQYTVA